MYGEHLLGGSVRLISSTTSPRKPETIPQPTDTDCSSFGLPEAINETPCQRIREMTQIDSLEPNSSRPFICIIDSEESQSVSRIFLILKLVFLD